MNNRISSVIIEIEDRFKNLTNALDSKKSELAELQAQLEERKQDLEKALSENGLLKEQLELLSAESLEKEKKYQELLDNQSMPVSSDSANDEAIDMLVREIDQCINQLKGNL